MRLRDGEARELRAVDDLAPGVVGARGEVSGVDPAADGVVADPEQARGLADPKVRHESDSRPASAECPPTEGVLGFAVRLGRCSLPASRWTPLAWG
ncbi:Uncharacterised protein [Mycobacteroides abscessus]|nr:Uncharacterised protein [Mycobacteroides abscessus]